MKWKNIHIQMKDYNKLGLRSINVNSIILQYLNIIAIIIIPKIGLEIEENKLINLSKSQRSIWAHAYIFVYICISIVTEY